MDLQAYLAFPVLPASWDPKVIPVSLAIEVKRATEGLPLSVYPDLVDLLETWVNLDALVHLV